MHIGNRISYIRKRNATSQIELAKGIISPTHLSNIEQGRYTPSADILIPIEKKLSLPSGYLVDYNNQDMELMEYLDVLKSKIINHCDNKLLEEMRKVDVFSIVNLQQEVLFSILLCSCLYKNNLRNEAELHIKEHLSYFISPENLDNLPQIILATYLYLLGIKSYYQNSYNDSLGYFKRLLELETDVKIKASIFYNLALLSNKLKKNHDAVYFANQSINLHLNNHNWNKVAELRNFIGVMYWENNDFEKAEIELDKVVDLLEIIEPKENVLARMLHNKGLVSKSKGEFEDAIKNFNKAITLKIRMNQSTILSDLGIIDCYIQMGETKLVKQNIEKSRNRNNSKINLLLLQYESVKLAHLMGEETIDKRVEIIKELENYGDIELLKGQYESLAGLFMKKKKYKQAAEYYKKELCLKGGDNQ